MVNFILSFVTTPIFYIPAVIVLFVLLLWAVYALGERNGAHHVYEKEQAALEAVAVPTPEERTEVSIVEALTKEMEITGYLEPTVPTSSIPIISVPAQMASEIASTGLITVIPPEESVSRLTVEKEVLIMQAEEWQRRAEKAEKLAHKHWNSLKAERARNRHLLGTYDLPRRPSKSRLLAEVIDISTRAQHKVVSLVPPVVANVWQEDLAVA